MFRTTIRVSEHTDVEAEVRAFRAACDQSELTSATCALIEAELRETLSELVDRGKQIATLGSHMSVERRIAGDGYEVIVSLGAGRKFTLLRRVMDTLRGR